MEGPQIEASEEGFNMPGIEEQLKIYVQWCKNNGVSPKDAKNLVTYVKEIREAYDADRWNLLVGCGAR